MPLFVGPVLHATTHMSCRFNSWTLVIKMWFSSTMDIILMVKNRLATFTKHQFCKRIPKSMFNDSKPYDPSRFFLLCILFKVLNNMLWKNFFVFNAGGGATWYIYRGNTDLTTPPTTLRQRVAENEKKTTLLAERSPSRRWFVERAHWVANIWNGLRLTISWKNKMKQQKSKRIRWLYLTYCGLGVLEACKYLNTI